MCRLDLVYYAVIGVFVLLRGLDCTCTDIYPNINTTQVANMCTDSKVTGTQVFLDTSVARSMSLEPGTICTCYVELQNGHFNFITNFTETTHSTTCGSYVYIHANEHFSSNISCLTKQSELEFQDRTNLTVEFMTTSTVVGDYCVNLGKVVCGDGEFQCRDGTCIPGGAICDNLPDCPDHSDETNCGPVFCDEGRLRCENGTGCFVPHQTCDGVADCPDGSDESVKNCVLCGDGEFQCTSDGTCIPGDARCDNLPDCPDQSDEDDCGPFPCGETDLRCESGTGCFSPDQKCDGVSDCRDGSDEYCATETPYITVTCLKLPGSTTRPTTTTWATTISKPTTPSPTEETSTKSAATTPKTTPRLNSSADPPDTTNVGMIVGIVLGALVFVVIIGLVVWKRRQW